MQEPLARPSLTTSWAYQHRMLFTAVMLAGGWAFAALTPSWFEKSSVLDWSIDAAGWVVYLGGALLRIWATLWIAGRKKQFLVTDGPYRASRNPLYWGTFLMAIGLALILKSLVFAAGLVLVLILYTWFVVPAEERYMRSRFADSYDAYCAQVPRWLPRLRSLRRDEVFHQSADRSAVYRECVRMIWWMALPLLAEITAHVRGTQWWKF